MAHPETAIDGGVQFEAVPMYDEEGRSIIVAISKATFSFDAHGRVSAAEPQPVRMSPVWRGDPASSSLEFDSDTALEKVGTDVVLIGHARSHSGPVQSLDVGVRVGPVQKIARVIGDRLWLLDGRVPVLSKTKPFESMPLIYERAFGGWDRSDADEAKHSAEARNPVGTGFGRSLRADGEVLSAPNIVDPRQPNIAYGDNAAPVGFGFVAPHWMPRSSFAGTYDELWDKTRKPLLPADFSRRYFNSASEGMMSAAPLRGDEQVTLVNVGAAPRIDFRLPAAMPPAVTLYLRDGRTADATGRLDTLVIEADDMRLSLVWRASVPTKDGLQDIVAMRVRAEPPRATAVN